MFSRRTPDEMTANALSRAIEARGGDLLDLTVSNPTRAGLFEDSDLLAPLADPRALRYEPAPRGVLAAREALAAHLCGKGIAADPARMFLTASTSEAYSFLFKLLCDPGDEVLVPNPSYPLLDHLLALECAGPAPYALELHEGGWRIDPGSLEAALTPRCRAIVVINPNNPTGSCVDAGSRARIASLARERNLAIISDEVFLDYGFGGVDLTGRSLAGEAQALTFVLGGLSKSLALPQLKLGWMLLSGPAAVLPECMERLELIADTYLSLAAPVQAALPGLLAREAERQAPIRARLEENRAALAELLRGSSLRALSAQGGWYAILALPAGHDDETLATALVQGRGVLVQPGYFYGLEDPQSVVVSLLTPSVDFRKGIAALVAHIGG